MGRGTDLWVYIVLAVLAFLVVGLFFVPLEWRIFDPSMYYAYIRSPLIDGDLDFANEAEPQEWWSTHVQRTETGKFPNVWSVGPAFLWTPATLLAHGTVLLLQRWGFPFAADGYALPYMVLIGLTTALVAFVGLLATYSLSRQQAPRFPALLATILVWLATPLWFYSARFTMMAHGLSFAAVALFLLTWLRLRRTEKPSAWCWLGLGALAGLMLLQRWQNALVLLVPLGTDLLERRLGRRRIAGYAWMALGTVWLFSPQMAMWQVLYGRPLLVPQGSGFFNWTRPALAAILFSSNRGLFLWSPLFLLGVVGLVWLWRRDRPLALPIALVCLLELYLNSVTRDWWGGGAYGPRRFIEILPLLVPGMAGLLARWTRLPWARIALVLLALLLIWQQWAWMDMVFYVDYGDGGHPLSPELYTLRYDGKGPWSVEAYRQYLQQGIPLPPTFYLYLYDEGLPLPWSVLLEPLRRSLHNPTALLQARPSRWSSQLPPLFVLAQRWKEGGAGRLATSWAPGALAIVGVGLIIAVFLWRRLRLVYREGGGCGPASWWGKALLIALLLAVGLVDVVTLAVLA